MATHSDILAWRILHGQKSLVGYSPQSQSQTKLKQLSSSSSMATQALSYAILSRSYKHHSFKMDAEYLRELVRDAICGPTPDLMNEKLQG